MILLASVLISCVPLSYKEWFHEKKVIIHLTRVDDSLKLDRNINVSVTVTKSGRRPFHTKVERTRFVVAQRKQTVTVKN